MRVRYSRILMWLLILSPIVDNINGYLLLSKGNSNISILFKTIIFIFCLIMSLRVLTAKKTIGIVCMTLILIFQLIMFEINDEGGIIYNISSIIKLLTPIVIVMSVHALESYDRSTKEAINRVSKFYCWFFPLSLIIPSLLKIGYATYSSGEGSKGFYFAGNEIAIIMIVVFALEFDKYKTNKSKENFLNVILGAVSILFIGTKTSYITLIIFILIMLYSGKKINRKFLSAILLMPIFFGGLWFLINNVTAMTESINAIFWRYRSRNIRGFLFSGRELRISRAIELVYSRNIIKKIFFGIGSDMAENGLKVLIEMDLADLFIRFGLVVAAVIAGFYIKNMKQVIQKKNILFIFGSFLTCGASVFAGHMLFSPMVSMVLMILFLKNEYEEKNEDNRDI